METVYDILQEISVLLEKHNASSNTLAIALLGDEKKLWDYLVSNELWGGAGSVADQALSGFPKERKLLEGADDTSGARADESRESECSHRNVGVRI
jgi:hypothetical protein